MKEGEQKGKSRQKCCIAVNKKLLVLRNWRCKKFQKQIWIRIDMFLMNKQTMHSVNARNKLNVLYEI